MKDKKLCGGGMPCEDSLGGVVSTVSRRAKQFEKFFFYLGGEIDLFEKFFFYLGGEIDLSSSVRCHIERESFLNWFTTTHHYVCIIESCVD